VIAGTLADGSTAALLDRRGAQRPFLLEQALPAASLAGRRIQVSADVAFVETDPAATSWAGILIDVVARSDGETSLNPDPAPFWNVLGHAAPRGEFRTIRAVFQVPAEARELILRIQAQPGIGTSVAAVRGLRIDAVQEP
jgi:hypothetical protein